MRFALSDEQQMLQDMLCRFLADRPDDPWAGLIELGVMGALFSEAEGGFGGTGADLAVVFEEIGRADCSLPLIDTVLLPGLLMTAAGRDIAPLIDGRERLALAHGELPARYDLNWVEARVDGDRLTGEKSVVVGAEDADRLIVSARHAGDVDAPAGIGLWLVRPDAEGLIIRGYDMAAGGRAAEVTLADTPGEPLLAEAFGAISKAVAKATLAQMAETVGAMETAVAMTRDYLGTREQFGRPIGSFQALAHRLVDVMVELEQARSAMILAAGHLDAEPRERDRHIAAAKNILGRSGRLVAEEAIQMHGGIAMTDEYALGRFAKRIIMADHRFGDTDHHLEQFIDLSR
ncbi:MAG: acyl-CoA dehydrogenase family protein [Geminicoccaceae bacterium]